MSMDQLNESVYQAFELTGEKIYQAFAFLRYNQVFDRLVEVHVRILILLPSAPFTFKTREILNFPFLLAALDVVFVANHTHFP